MKNLYSCDKLCSLGEEFKEVKELKIMHHEEFCYQWGLKIMGMMDIFVINYALKVKKLKNLNNWELAEKNVSNGVKICMDEVKKYANKPFLL